MITIANTDMPVWSLVAAALFGMLLHSCGDNDNSPTDCSRRGKPQYYDHRQQDWTCADRDKKR